MVSDLESLQAAADADANANADPDPDPGPDDDPDPDPGPDPDPDPGPDPGPDDDPDPDDDPQAFTKWYDERFGRSYTQQFKTDQEFVDALNEKDRLVGQRNDDAQLLKQLRDRIGEDRLKGLLAEEPAPPGKSKPARDANLPRSVDEYMLLQDAAGRSDATPAVREKFATAQKALFERLLTPGGQNTESLQAEITEAVSKSVAEEMKKHRQTADEERTQERTVTAEKQWLDQNRSKLFVDNTQNAALTPLGTRMDEILRTDPDIQDLPQVNKWRLAMKIAASEQPTPNQPRKPSHRAQRQAPVKTGTPKEKTQEERLKDAPSGAAFFQGEWERDKAAATAAP